MLYTKFQENISCDSGKKADFNGLAFFLARVAIFDSRPG